MGNGHTSRLGRENGLIQRLVERIPLPGQWSIYQHISGITGGVIGLNKNMSGHMHCARIPQIRVYQGMEGRVTGLNMHISAYIHIAL